MARGRPCRRTHRLSPTHYLAALVKRSVSVLRIAARVVRPRGALLVRAAKRPVGAMVLLLVALIAKTFAMAVGGYLLWQSIGYLQGHIL